MILSYQGISNSMSGTDEPLVSVVVPTYYRNDRLRDAIESVLAQEYGHVELLVVDDSGERCAGEVLGGATRSTSSTTGTGVPATPGARASSGLRGSTSSCWTTTNCDPGRFDSRWN